MMIPLKQGMMDKVTLDLEKGSLGKVPKKMPKLNQERVSNPKS